MNINSVSPVSCKGNIPRDLRNVRKLSVPLKDGSTASFTSADNYLECLITKGNRIVEGRGKYSVDGITSKDLWSSYEKIQAHVKSGVDFFKEFTKTILS